MERELSICRLTSYSGRDVATLFVVPWSKQIGEQKDLPIVADADADVYPAPERRLRKAERMTKREDEGMISRIELLNSSSEWSIFENVVFNWKSQQIHLYIQAFNAFVYKEAGIQSFMANNENWCFCSLFVFVIPSFSARVVPTIILSIIVVRARTIEWNKWQW